MLEISRRVVLLGALAFFSTSAGVLAEANPEAINPFAKVPQKICKDCKKCGPWCKCDCKSKCRCKRKCCSAIVKMKHHDPNHTPDPFRKHHPCPKCKKNKNKN